MILNAMCSTNENPIIVTTQFVSDLVRQLGTELSVTVSVNQNGTKCQDRLPLSRNIYTYLNIYIFPYSSLKKIIIQFIFPS